MLRQMAARAAPLLAGGLAAGALAAPAFADKKEKEKDVRGPSFDPEALERGAKALREINSSPHSKQARRAGERRRGAGVGGREAGQAGCLSCACVGGGSAPPTAAAPRRRRDGASASRQPRQHDRRRGRRRGGAIGGGGRRLPPAGSAAVDARCPIHER